MHQYRLETNRLSSSLAEKTGVLLQTHLLLKMSQQHMIFANKAKCLLGYTKKRIASR